MEKERSHFKLYRIKSKVPAVKRDGTGVEEIVTLYPGTAVLATGEARNSGYVDVFADGEFLSVLTRHLEEDAELTIGPGAPIKPVKPNASGV
jgi:hypothetical protein